MKGQHIQSHDVAQIVRAHLAMRPPEEIMRAGACDGEKYECQGASFHCPSGKFDCGDDSVFGCPEKFTER